MRRNVAVLAVLLVSCQAGTDINDTANIHVLQDADREFILEQYLQAAGHYEAFLGYNKDYPQRARVRLMAGRAYLGAGRVDQAITTFDRAVADTPSPVDRWDIVFHRAVAYRMKGEISRAIDGFRSVATAPATERSSAVTTDELHYEYALALFRDGDWRGGQGELALVAPRGAFGAKARLRLGLASFTVQVGAYSSDALARSEAEKVKGLVRAIPGDRPLYAVTWGAFARYEDAQREADRLKRQYGDAFVIP
jgi:tetratricopeptide (TPR) repeat protein